MVLKGHSTAAARSISDGDELGKSRCALDRGLVNTGIRVYGVCTAVTGDGALNATKTADANVGFHDIILDEWVGSPAIDTETA